MAVLLETSLEFETGDHPVLKDTVGSGQIFRFSGTRFLGLDRLNDRDDVLRVDFIIFFSSFHRRSLIHQTVSLRLETFCRVFNLSVVAGTDGSVASDLNNEGNA